MERSWREYHRLNSRSAILRFVELLGGDRVRRIIAVDHLMQRDGNDRMLGRCLRYLKGIAFRVRVPIGALTVAGHNIVLPPCGIDGAGLSSGHFSSQFGGTNQFN